MAWLPFQKLFNKGFRSQMVGKKYVIKEKTPKMIKNKINRRNRLLKSFKHHPNSELKKESLIWILRSERIFLAKKDYMSLKSFCLIIVNHFGTLLELQRMLVNQLFKYFWNTLFKFEIFESTTQFKVRRSSDRQICSSTIVHLILVLHCRSNLTIS